MNKNKTCHDCGVSEGEIHQFGCDMEKCPLCGWQLLSCNCIYEFLGYDVDDEKPFSGLPEDVSACHVNEWAPASQLREYIVPKDRPTLSVTLRDTSPSSGWLHTIVVISTKGFG